MTKERKKMTTWDWMMCGYKDAIERTPDKRAPDYPHEILHLITPEAPPEVIAYDDGWHAGINDTTQQLLRQYRMKQESQHDTTPKP